MMESSQAAEFDVRPPVPVEEYEATVRRVNVGYALVFDLAMAYLRSLQRPELSLLVVGAGGGMELATFGPGNPGWHFTGVDPSEHMLALASAKVDALGLSERVTLQRGTVTDLPVAARYDAATCIFVLHFVRDVASKLALLRSIAQRLQPGAPLLLVSPVLNSPTHEEEFMGAWQHYGQAMGMPPTRMASILEELRSRPPPPSEERHEALLREAGFGTVTRFFTAFLTTGWVAR